MQSGADVIHGTALGVGERSGNAPLDQTLVNLSLMGVISNDLTSLNKYVQKANEYIEVPLPKNYPVFGSDAFETGTGVHASAVVKALRKGDSWLADRVYSGVPAEDYGLEQVIRVGHMSGKSNIIHWLEAKEIEVEDSLVEYLFNVAKSKNRLMTDEELLSASRRTKKGLIFTLVHFENDVRTSVLIVLLLLVAPYGGSAEGAELQTSTTVDLIDGLSPVIQSSFKRAVSEDVNLSEHTGSWIIPLRKVRRNSDRCSLVERLAKLTSSMGLTCGCSMMNRANWEISFPWKDLDSYSFSPQRRCIDKLLVLFQTTLLPRPMASGQHRSIRG